ncbi:MAG: hypothetical protein D6778_10050, partial [Nitrospirae bacterium]
MKRVFTDKTTGLFFLGMVLVYLYWSPVEKPFEHLISFLTNSWGVVLLFGSSLSLFGTGVMKLFYPFRTEGIKKTLVGTFSVEAISEVLRRRHFRVRSVEDSLVAEKGRFGILPGVLLRLSLSGLLVCLFLSVHLRQVSEVYLTEEGRFSVFGKNYRVKKINVPLPEDILIVGEKEGLKVKTIEVVLEGEGGIKNITNGFPRSVDGVYFVPKEVCYKHSIDVNHNGKTLSKEIFLEVLPPGRSQPVRTDFDDIVFGFKLHPEK